MKFDRKPAVRRGNEDTFAANPPCFTQEHELTFPAADMFKYRARMDVVERRIGKRQTATVGAHKPNPRMHFWQKRGVIQTGCCHPVFIAVPRLEVVGMVVALVARDSYVENSVDRIASAEIE